jgi:tRNA U34 5-methylaminomethyl-2-thiouridine-forming methyltransferase MnmC
MSGSAATFEFITTADGSTSLYVPSIDETYHSRHGAVQESQHVFVQMGLDPVVQRITDRPIRILEVGFGTGLNALLTASFGRFSVEYFGLDTVPLPPEVYQNIGFDGLEDALLQAMHKAPWNMAVEMKPGFVLHKMPARVQEAELPLAIDLVYYDAFGPRAQGEMWELPVFQRLFDVVAAGGVLVTYCAKGQVRRDLHTAGFVVERLAGPPGKREMLRATRQ